MKNIFMVGLALVFIALKLMGSINWSWWLVLLPLYGPVIVELIVVFVVAMKVSLKNVHKQR